MTLEFFDKSGTRLRPAIRFGTVEVFALPSVGEKVTIAGKAHTVADRRYRYSDAEDIADSSSCVVTLVFDN